MLSLFKGFLRFLGLLGTQDVISSRDIIPHSAITFANNTITIKGVKGPIRFAQPTSKSMDPIMDVGHTNILSLNSEYFAIDKLGLGDLIAWEKWVIGGGIAGKVWINHQIVKIGEDKEGWFCYTKGLNNAHRDRDKIREEQIKGITIGVIW